MLEGDKTYISPSYTRSYPLVAKRGRGVVVEDVDGNEFLDFSAGIAVTSTGHCHPEVVAAIQKQAAELIHMSGTDFYYENMITLAERLSAVAPMKGPHRFYYGNSGAEAIEAAIKLARYHTRRQNIIAFYGAFHGRTMGALSLTASKVQQRRRFFPLMPGVTHVPYPNVYRRPRGTDPVEYAVDCARFIEQKVLEDHAAAGRSGRHLRRAHPGRRRLRGRARRNSCWNCAASATSTASCWSPTKCSAAPGAAASGGPSSTPASSPTSSASPRASPPACRWA